MKLKLILALALLCLPISVSGQTPNRRQGIITTNGPVACTTAGSCVRFELPANTGSVSVQVTGTYTGTLSLEATGDGSNYVAAPACFSSSGQVTSTAATDVLFQCSTGGLTGFQVRGSAAMTGAAGVVMQASGASAGAVATGGGSTQDVNVVGNDVALATETLQTTGNAILTTIDADTGNIATSTAAASTSLGATTVDRCTTTDTTSCTLVGLAKQNNYLLTTPTGQQTMANSNSVTIASNQTLTQYQFPSTAIVYTETGGTATFTPKNVATGAGRVSNQVDRGAGALPTLMKWEAQFKAQANVTIGNPVRVYAYCSQNASTSTDLSADAAVAAETTFSNFRLLGTVYANVNTAGTFYGTGDVWLSGRYCEVGLWNASGQTFTNVDGDNKITLTPMPYQVVAQ